MLDKMENVKRTRGRPPLLTDLDRKRNKAAHNSKLNEARIYVGVEIGRWNWLKERLQLKSHAEVAKVLLDCYLKHQCPASESGNSTNQGPPSNQLLRSQTSLNSAVLFGELDTRPSEITSVPWGNAVKLEPVLSLTCDERGSSSNTCNDQQDFDQTQVETRLLPSLQTTQRSHLDALPYSAISSSPLYLGSGASGDGTSSLVPGESANRTSSNVPANLTVIIKTEDGVEVDETDTYGLSRDTGTGKNYVASESLVASMDNDVIYTGLLQAERKTIGEETEAESGNSGKENMSSAQFSQDEFQRHLQPDYTELTRGQTLGTKRQYGKTHVEDSASIKNLEKSSSLKKAQDVVEYKKRPRMVRFEDEIDDKNKRISSRLKNKGFRIDYADYDELNDISDLESEGMETESDCLGNMLEESVEPVDGGSNESNSSLKPKESVKPTDDASTESNSSLKLNESVEPTNEASNESNSSIQLEESVERTNEASNESNSSIQLEESVEPTDEASNGSNSSIQLVESVEPIAEESNESNLRIQSNENDSSVKASIGKRHIEEDPDFDPEEFNGNKKRKKDVKKAPKGTNIPPADSGNELEDLPEAIDQFKTVDMMKKELEKRKNRIKVTLENHKDLFYEEEVVSLQRKDRAKSQEDITTVLLVCAVCKKYKTGNKTGLEMHLEQHLNGDFDCDKCDEKFESSYLLKLHMSEAHVISTKKKPTNKNKFKCPECSLDFRISHSFREHMGTVHGKKAVPCKVCFEIYPTSGELREHTKQMHKETMAQCDSCSDFFYSRKGLRSHREMCGKVDNVSCEICGKQMTPAGLRIHLKHVHENVRLHNCPSCSYTAKTSDRLRLHIKSLHTGEHTYKCDQCPFTCVQKIQLTSHMRTHTGEKPYKCDECPYAAAWNVQMDRTTKSLKISAVKETKDECGGMIYKCNKCLYKTWRESNLKRHMTSKHVKSEGREASNTPMISLISAISAVKETEDECDDKIYKCNKCTYKTEHKSNLKRHMTSKHVKSDGPEASNTPMISLISAISAVNETEDEFDDKIYKCNKCTYKTGHKGNLKRHMKIKHVNSERPEASNTPMISLVSATKADDDSSNSMRFVCDKCGKVFATKYGFYLHVKNKHQQVFKFMCEWCGKGYNQRSQFKSHCAGHKGVDPDKCVYCGKTFSGYGSLLRHVKTCVDALGTNLDRLICNECGHTFPNKQTLGEHIRGKHQKPHYACQQCGKQFAWRSSLAHHKKHAHRGLWAT